MRLPRFAIDLADDIAALVVREFEFGVLAQEDAGAAPLVAAIAAARYRGCDEFGTDHPVLGYQIAAEILMLVAGEDDIVLQPRHARQDALARRLIARPAVEIEDLLRLVGFPPPVRSEERLGGKEWVRECKSAGAP